MYVVLIKLLLLVMNFEKWIIYESGMEYKTYVALHWWYIYDLTSFDGACLMAHGNESLLRRSIFSSYILKNYKIIKKKTFNWKLEWSSLRMQ